MPDISTLHSYRCDLNLCPCEVELRKPLMHQDALADVFRAEVCRGNESIDLTGMTVYGYLYFAATRQTLVLTGSISRNFASVTLTDDCYAMPGWCSLVIQLRNGDVRHTVLKVDFVIKRTGSENVYFPANSPTMAELMARIEALEAGGGGGSGGAVTEAIPAYWLTHLQNRAARIREAMAAAGWDKSAFLWYHDAHWTYNYRKSPMLLKYLHQNTSINKTFFGGDIVDSEGDDSAAMAYLWDWRAAIRDLPNHHSVPGNHDDGNSPDNRWDDAYIYNFLMASEETCDMIRGEALYYYIDNPSEKTRYICLDTATYDGNIGYNAAQQGWLKETLLGTPGNWHIVAIAHIWLNVNYDVNPPVATGFSVGGKTALNMFDAYNARTGEYAGCTGRVEFCIGGHSHVDADRTSDGGIPVLLTECDSRHIRSGLSCTSGTISEASINAIVADYAHGVINVIRVGRGVGRIVKLDGSGSESDGGGDSGEPEDTSWMTTTITRVMQTSDDTVALEWRDNVAGVTYVVYEGDKAVARVTNNTQVVLFGVTPGVHAYTVRPQKSDSEVGHHSSSVSITTVSDVGFVNVLRIATDESGNLYNGGYGYKENTRINSSFQEVEATGWDQSGYFPAQAGDIIRFYNMDFLDLDGSGGQWPRNNIYGYNEDYSIITNVSGEDLDKTGDITWALVRDTDNDIIQFKMVSAWNSVSIGQIVAKLRVNARNIDAFSIITVNEVANV